MSPAGRAGSAREEAERLVATVLAAAAMAARSGGGGTGPGNLGAAGMGGLWSAIGLAQRALANPDLATGEPACCVCPLCRLITAIRDPSPEFAERLATGAGDVATGVAGIMRAFGAAGRGADDGSAPRDSDEPDGWAGATEDPRAGAAEDPWAAATAAGRAPTGPPEGPASGTAADGPGGWPADAGAVWSAATDGGRATSGNMPDTRRAPDAGADPDIWRIATRATGGPLVPPQASGPAADDVREPATPPGEAH